MRALSGLRRPHRAAWRIAVRPETIDLEQTDQVQRFLAEAGEALACLDHAAILARLARLLVPVLADYCAIDLIDASGAIRHVESNHHDPAKMSLVRALQRYAPASMEHHGSRMIEALQSGEVMLHDHVTDEHFRAHAHDEEHLRILRLLGPRSYLMVPLLARGRALGAIELVYTDSLRRHGPAALEVARDLARRAALAVDNARLHAEVQEQARTLTAILSASVDNLYIIDGAGQYRYVSMGGAHVLGHEPADMQGKTWQALGLPAEIMEQVDRQREEVMATGVPQRHVIHALETPFSEDYEYSLAPIHDQAGIREGVICISRDMTERRQAEASMRAGEERLRLALAAARMIAWEWNMESNEITLSESAAAVLGLPAGTMSVEVQEAASWFHPDDLPRYREHVSEALAHGGSYLAQIRLRRSDDDTLLWMEDRGHVTCDAEGKPIRLSGVVMDISERKQAEAAAQAAHRAAERAAARTMRLQTITAALSEALTPIQVAEVMVEQGLAALEASAGVVVMVSEDGEALELLRAVGIPDDVIAAYRRFPLDTPLPVADAIRTGELLLLPSELQPDGGYAHLADIRAKLNARASASIPLLVKGRALGALALSFTTPREFSDDDRKFMLTLARQCAQALERARLYEAEQNARLQAEAAQRRFAFLAEAAATLAASPDYRQALASLAELAASQLADWCIIDMLDDNRAVQRLGLAHRDPDRLEFLRDLDRRFHTFDSPECSHNQALRAGSASVAPTVTEDMLRDIAQEEEHLVLLRAIGVHSSMSVPIATHGRILGAITFTISDPERCYGPDDLALAEDLARRVALAVDLAQLYQEAREANRLKDEFLATVSHELRTPLNAMTGWIHLLRSGKLDDKTTERALETLQRNAKSQSQLINDILDVSRIITGKLQLEVRAIDLAPIIHAAVEVVRPAAEAKGIRLRYRIAPGVSQVMADPGRLQQVVWNLLSNAIKFTPDGGEVEVEARRRRGYVDIAVSDTGQGIAPGFLPHAFERFRQADSSTTRAHGGLGLGLAIVRHLVELHGGTVHATSEGEGHGAQFTVRIPLASVRRDGPRWEGVMPIPSAEASPFVHAALPPLGHLRLLVVDDDLDTLDMLAETLSRCGATVARARSAAEALSWLEREQFDILISDISMPEQDGYALIRKVRARSAERGGCLPAIALTAYARAADRATALAAGFDAHVPKPVDPAELPRVVASLCNRQPPL